MPKKSEVQRRVTAEGLAVGLLRSLRGWSQKQLADASGVDKTLIWRYEAGRKIPSRHTLERICAAVGVPFSFIEALLPSFRHALALVGKGGEKALPARSIPLAEVEGELAQLGLPVESQASRSTPEQVRLEAQDLWENLEKRTAHDRRVLVEGGRKYKSWALCERLCFASETAATDDAGKALDLAKLAVRIAELVPEQEAFRLGLQGYAWAYLGNARRVKGDLPGADEAFARSDKFLSVGGQAITGVLDTALLPDLKA